MNKSETPKPLMLAMQEAEQELVSNVNGIMQKHNIPCYFFEMIFDKIHRQIKDGAMKELSNVKADYAKKPAIKKDEPG